MFLALCINPSHHDWPSIDHFYSYPSVVVRRFFLFVRLFICLYFGCSLLNKNIYIYIYDPTYPRLKHLFLIQSPTSKYKKKRLNVTISSNTIPCTSVLCIKTDYIHIFACLTFKLIITGNDDLHDCGFTLAMLFF